MRDPYFPAFGRGLSLRLRLGERVRRHLGYFPTFGWGLSLRLANFHCHAVVYRISPPSDDQAAVSIDIS